jgi:hypothetical protein
MEKATTGQLRPPGADSINHPAVQVKSVTIQGVRERAIKHLNNIPFLYVAISVGYFPESCSFYDNANIAIKCFIYCVQRI